MREHQMPYPDMHSILHSLIYTHSYMQTLTLTLMHVLPPTSVYLCSTLRSTRICVWWAKACPPVWARISRR
jgi:hypothetical protein